MADLEIRVTLDNVDEVIRAVRGKIRQALSAMGEVVEGYAKEDCPVDTGNLRNSITHEAGATGGEPCEYVGTNVEYAPYVEFGTGIYASNGMGRQTPWVYKGADGAFHRTVGMHPSHFLRDAGEQHIDELRNTALTVLRTL